MTVSGNLFPILTPPDPFKLSFFDNSNLVSLTVLLTLRPFTLFNLKLEQLSCKKALKIALLGNCFFDLFTEVEI